MKPYKPPAEQKPELSKYKIIEFYENPHFRQGNADFFR